MGTAHPAPLDFSGVEMKKNLTASLILLLFANATWAAAMPPLARQHGCPACHDMDKMMVGPPWMDVSRKYLKAKKYKYKDHEYTLEDGLVMKVSDGGDGNWGSMPMPPNDPNHLNQNDMRELVRFILQLAK